MTALLGRGWQFEFVQAVQLLEQGLSGGSRVGGWGPFDQEQMRFVPSSRLSPTNYDIQEIRFDGQTKGGLPRLKIVISFMGLYGMSAPGPPYVFETCAQPDAEVLRDFLDIFNNRAIALYYRACKKYRWPFEFRGDGSDPTSRRVFALLGLPDVQEFTPLGVGDDQQSSADADRSETHRPHIRLLRYLGLLTQRPRCATNLQRLLCDYFWGPDTRDSEIVQVEEFVVRWLQIPKNSRTRLGQTNSSLRGPAVLDNPMILGKRIRECVGKFRITIGPMCWQTFQKFLPTGSSYRELTWLVDLFRPQHLDYDIALRLKADEVPKWKLGGSQLGWTTWARNQLGVQTEEGCVTVRPSAKVRAVLA